MAYVTLGSYVALGSTATVPPEIKKGSKGEPVRQAQRLLNEWAAANNVGFTLVVDGDFGNETYNATMQYQRVNKDADGQALVVDGIIGRRTWSALLKLPRVPAASSTSSSSSASTTAPAATTPPVVTPPLVTPPGLAQAKGGIPLWAIAGVAGGVLWAFWPQISGKSKQR